jgi:hypothetical protein
MPASEWGQRDEAELEAAAAEREAEQKAAVEKTAANENAPANVTVETANEAVELFVKKIWTEAEKAVSERYRPLFESYDQLVSLQRKSAAKLCLKNGKLWLSLFAAGVIAAAEAIVLICVI